MFQPIRLKRIQLQHLLPLSEVAITPHNQCSISPPPLPSSSSHPRGFDNTSFQDSSYAARLKNSIVSASIISTPPTSMSTIIPPLHHTNSGAEQEALAAKSLFSSGTNISVRQLDNLVRDDIHSIEALFL